MLTEAKGVYEGDFYSYRYLVAEGLLPGYNFPRLPLSADVPARRQRKGQDEFISRPRFLAISEFGPRVPKFYVWLKKLINDPAVEVVVNRAGGREPGAPFRIDSVTFRSFEAARKVMFPGRLPCLRLTLRRFSLIMAQLVRAFAMKYLSAVPSKRPIF